MFQCLKKTNPHCSGITAVVGGRPKPSPCLKLYSFLQSKSSMPATVTVNGEKETYTCPAFESSSQPEIAPPSANLMTGSNTAKVNDLAFTRSGDKVVILFFLNASFNDDSGQLLQHWSNCTSSLLPSVPERTAHRGGGGGAVQALL